MRVGLLYSYAGLVALPLRLPSNDPAVVQEQCYPFNDFTYKNKGYQLTVHNFIKN